MRWYMSLNYLSFVGWCGISMGYPIESQFMPQFHVESPNGRSLKEEHADITGNVDTQCPCLSGFQLFPTGIHWKRMAKNTPV